MSYSGGFWKEHRIIKGEDGYPAVRIQLNDAHPGIERVTPLNPWRKYKYRVVETGEAYRTLAEAKKRAALTDRAEAGQ